MYCKAITIRLLVGRLTPAMRAKSATPCSGQTVADPRKVPAAIYRFECHLRKATNVKSQRLPCLLRPGIAAHLRLDISGLLMDSRRFRQPPRVISPGRPTETRWPTPQPCWSRCFLILFLHRTRISSRIDLLTFFLSRRDRRDPTCGRCREGLVYGLCDFGDRCHAIDRTQHSLLPVMRD